MGYQLSLPATSSGSKAPDIAERLDGYITGGTSYAPPAVVMKIPQSDIFFIRAGMKMPPCTLLAMK